MYRPSSPANHFTQLIDVVKDHIFVHRLTHSAATCTANQSHATYRATDEWVARPNCHSNHMHTLDDHFVLLGMKTHPLGQTPLR